MSYGLINALYELFQNDTVLQGLVGHRDDGKLSISFQHFRDAVDPVYPLITFGRFGSGQGDNMFNEDPLYAGRMDHPKIEICVWDKAMVDNCWAIYQRIDQLLRGSAEPAAVPSHHIQNYRFVRLVVRDDLFDDAIAAYHLHSEYQTWVYENPVNPVPIPA